MILCTKSKENLCKYIHIFIGEYTLFSGIHFIQPSKKKKEKKHASISYSCMFIQYSLHIQCNYLVYAYIYKYIYTYIPLLPAAEISHNIYSSLSWWSSWYGNGTACKKKPLNIPGITVLHTFLFISWETVMAGSIFPRLKKATQEILKSAKINIFCEVERKQWNG